MKQLRHFYKKDQEAKYSNESLYVKAFYIHHLLDYFRETRFDIHNLDLVFTHFLQEKVIDELYLEDGKKINFQKEIQSIFKLFKHNKDQLFADLEGDYISPNPKKNNT
ncbi:MAG: hypothetical protein P8Y23_06360 [Candidatus Lokiarchaeota archaeon]